MSTYQCTKCKLETDSQFIHFFPKVTKVKNTTHTEKVAICEFCIDEHNIILGDDEDMKNMELMEKYANHKAIGYWTLSNSHGVEMLDIEHDIDDIAIVRYGDEIIECIIQYGETYYSEFLDGDELDTYIQIGELILSMNECMRINQ